MSERLLSRDGVRLVLPVKGTGIPGRESRETVLPGGPLGAWAWVNTTLPRALRTDEVLWSPTIRAPLRRSHHVATVHDLSVLDHPEWFRRPVVLQWRFLLPQLCRSGAGIVTDSQFSKERIVDRLGLQPEQVDVVTCGVDPRFGAVTPEDLLRVQETYQLPESYILSVGSVDPRKNVALLLDAWQLLEEPLREGFPIILVGGTERTFASDPAFARLPAACRHLGYVPDADLPALYAAASTFAFPSRYEGFGLPPLESMASGTPVVALGSTAAVVEVVGDAGLLAQDDSPEAFADVLRTSLDVSTSRDLSRSGLLRAASYTWDRAADQLLAVLESRFDSVA